MTFSTTLFLNNSPQECPKRPPRGPQESLEMAPRDVRENASETVVALHAASITSLSPGPGRGGGGGASGQSAQDCSKRASESPRLSPRWTEIKVDGSRSPPTRIQEASRRPIDGLKCPPSSPRTPQDAKLRQTHTEKQCGFALSQFRFRWALEASRWSQDGPRGPQEGALEGPKRAPRAPKSARAAQEGPKTPV